MPHIRKKVDPMEKAIPRNPRYEDIGPTVDTGASMSKYLKKMEEIRETDSKKSNDFGGQNTHESGDVTYSQPPPTTRSTLQNLIHGVGEFDANMNLQNYLNQNEDSSIVKPNDRGDMDTPYLLLDIRDREEYDACHIITALNYPIAMLSRSVNFETTEMLAFRNKPGCVIIIYDEDERCGPRAATTLVQRGYQNVFLLSGGLRLAWKYFPEGLIIGEMPASIRQSLKMKTRGKAPVWIPQLSRINSASTVGTATTQNVSNISVSRPRASAKTPIIYCQPGSRDNANGVEEFLCEDILKLTLSMEKGVDDGRSNRSSYTRDTTTAARRSTSTPSIHKRPFR